jgi:putative hydrolase of the HAD superfamily
MRPLSRVRAITFDAEGTLIHPCPSVGEIYSQVLARYGLIVPAPQLEKAFRASFGAAHDRIRENINDDTEKDFWRSIVCQTVNKFGSVGKFHELFEELYERFGSAKYWRLTEEAMPTLQALRKQGYRLAILSNWDGRLRRVLSEMGLCPLFEKYFISCEIGFEKPDLRIFSFAQEALRLSPHEILHVGNSLVHDAKGALNAGWISVLVGTENDPTMEGCLIIPQLKDLLDLLGDRQPKS